MESSLARADELPGFVADRVQETIGATSLEDARGRADRLIADAAEEPHEVTTPDDPADVVEVEEKATKKT